MKKILFVFSLMLIFNLSSEAYTYQWNVPYDNHGTIYPGNVQGGYYYAGNNAIIPTQANKIHERPPRNTYYHNDQYYQNDSYHFDNGHKPRKKHKKHQRH